MKTLFRAWFARVAGLFNQRHRDSEFAQELESHLQMHVDDNLRAGMTPQEARRAALITLGGVQATREAYRDRGTVPVVENLTQDVRFAVRQLRKNPGFAAAAVIVLALGLCASVAIFAFVDAALFKPLPFRDPNRLVDVTESLSMIRRANLSYLDFMDWKALNKVFGSLDIYNGRGFLMKTPEGAVPIGGARVSSGFFRTLGISPMLGRDFTANEDQVGATRVTLLSHSGWMKRFGGRPDVVGQTMILSGVPYEIIGVLPKEFQFAPRARAEVWTALQPDSECEKRRSCHNLYGVARLKDGVSVQEALANMISIAAQLEAQYPNSNRGQSAIVSLLSDQINRDVQPILLTLLGGAGLLLLIACVNVVSLLLVRSESRRREFAVRAALGASSGRIVSQFMTEGAVLVTAGCFLGVSAANWTIRLLLSLIPEGMLSFMPFLQGVGLNYRVLAFTAAISLLVAGALSFAPIVHASFAKWREDLAEGSRGSAGVVWRKLGAKLVVAELAVAMVLLVGAGLLGQSLQRLLGVELGFQPEHLATISVAAPETAYPKSEQVVALQKEIEERVSHLPGVESAGTVSDLPVSFNGNTTWIRFVGKPYNGEHNESNYRVVSATYFQTVGAKLARGRYFTEFDDASKPHVVIINQTLARKYFPSEDPVGKQIANTDLSPKSIREIVGVVEDIKDGSLDSEIWPAVYHPFKQDPDGYFSVVARTAQTPQAILQTLASSIHKISAELGAYDEKTMVDRITDSQTAYLHRWSAWLVGSFAALALLLSIVGLYGVVSYSVSQRTREIGVRMALGAETGTVYQMVLKEAGWLTALGIAFGVVLSIGAANLGKSMLFGVSSWDVPTLAGVAAVLSVAAVLASFAPARRAISVNPVDALRSE